MHVYVYIYIVNLDSSSKKNVCSCLKKAWEELGTYNIIYSNMSVMSIYLS